ncbi:EIF2AK4 [Symbiodinium microadriaticum]|nr:EIF2AK4 [Symbiodinium microadriaticum]
MGQQCGCCTPSIEKDDIPEVPLASQASQAASIRTNPPALSVPEVAQAGYGESFATLATLVPDRASFRTLVPDRGSFSTLIPDRKSFETLQPSRLSFGTLLPDRLSFQAPLPEEPEHGSESSEKGEVRANLYAESLEAQAVQASKVVPPPPARGFLGRFASIRKSSAPYRGALRPAAMAHEEEQALEIEASNLWTVAFQCSQSSFSLFLAEKRSCVERERAGELRVCRALHMQENHVGVVLHVTYTDAYPDEPPIWELEDVLGLSDEKLEQLKEKITETIESSIGMAMIYSVTEACQDFLKDNNQKELSMHEQMMLRHTAGEDDDEEEEEGEEEEEEEEEPEWKGLTEKALCPESERITAESFAAWKVKFDAEMVECGVLKRDEVKSRSGKLIFMQGQEGEERKKEENGYPAGKSDVLVYDAALFGEEDADLDDIEDD